MTFSSYMIDVQDMLLFAQVSEFLSFSRASELTGVPVSTLSRRINLLEKRIGVRLLERSTRRLNLTEIGEQYLVHCKQIIKAAENAKVTLERNHTQIAGNIRISMPVEFGLFSIAPVLDEFARLYPEVSFNLQLTPERSLLIDEKIDICIRLGKLEANSVIGRSLGVIPRYLYASQEFVDQNEMPTAPVDLKKYPCILPSYATQPNLWQLQYLDRVAQVQEVEVAGRFSTNSMSMTRQLIEQSHGIGILSPQAFHFFNHDSKLVRVLDDWQFTPQPVHAIYSNRMLSTRIRLLLDFLSKNLRHSL